MQTETRGEWCGASASSPRLPTRGGCGGPPTSSLLVVVAPRGDRARPSRRRGRRPWTPRCVSVAKPSSCSADGSGRWDTPSSWSGSWCSCVLTAFRRGAPARATTWSRRGSRWASRLLGGLARWHPVSESLRRLACRPTRRPSTSPCDLPSTTAVIVAASPHLARPFRYVGRAVIVFGAVSAGRPRRRPPDRHRSAGLAVGMVAGADHPPDLRLPRRAPTAEQGRRGPRGPRHRRRTMSPRRRSSCPASRMFTARHDGDRGPADQGVRPRRVGRPVPHLDVDRPAEHGARRPTRAGRARAGRARGGGDADGRAGRRRRPPRRRRRPIVRRRRHAGHAAGGEPALRRRLPSPIDDDSLRRPGATLGAACTRSASRTATSTRTASVIESDGSVALADLGEAVLDADQDDTARPTAPACW